MNLASYPAHEEDSDKCIYIKICFYENLQIWKKHKVCKGWFRL